MPENRNVDVAIIGGGLIGLSTAFHLMEFGQKVAVVSGTTTGRASTAAAGMLTPACEYDPWMPRSFLQLLQAGLDYYPQFLERLVDDTAKLGYRKLPFTLVDLKERGTPLMERMEWMPGLGFDCEWLDVAHLCAIEPNVSPTAIRGGIRIQDQGVVNPVALWEALNEAVDRRGAVRRSGGVSGVNETAGGALQISSTDCDAVTASRVVIAAGAWSTEVAALMGLDLRVAPVKGQMLLLEGEQNLTNSVLFMPSGGCGSIVERVPGSYVVGTSEEYTAPNEHNTAAVVSAILSRLCRVIPAARNWRIDQMWSGFRPMISDELPMLSVATDPRVVLSFGHHRNGILLTPITGKITAEMAMEKKTHGFNLDDYHPSRDLRPHTRFADKY